MKMLFFGAGVLGSLYAAQLNESGHDVYVLARGSRLQSIRSEGIVLQHAFSGRVIKTHVKVVETLEPTDHYDYIIVLVRKNQVDDVLSIISKNKNTPNILVMVNNPLGYDNWIDMIGKDRLLVGFAGAGGTLQNGIVKYALAPGFFQPTTLAELDGSRTNRLIEIVKAFKQAGFPTTISRNMDAWQKSHVAWVSPLANSIYMAEHEGLDLTHSRLTFGLTVDAIRESFQVLEELAIPVTPSIHKFWQVIPKLVLVETLLLWSRTKHFKTLVMNHSLIARDEMKQIAEDYSVLTASASMAAPALNRLGEYARIQN